MEGEMTLATSTVSLLIASDFPVFRDRVDMILEEATGVDIVASVKEMAGLSQRASEVDADVVLMDLDLPWDAICREVAALAALGIPTLVIADPMDSERTIELLQSGGSGILGRRTAPELLLKSIRAVAAGELWISRHVTFDVIRLLRGLERDRHVAGDDETNGSNLARLEKNGNEQGSGNSTKREPVNTFGLTPRELEVTAAVVDGQTNKDIAETFGISVSTVKHHLTSIFDKLGVYNRVELVLFALNRELVPNAIEKLPDVRTSA
jgi:two-component system nitrate/nitrite response regulator NarL